MQITELSHQVSNYVQYYKYKGSGLQITAGQRTMSGQNWVLTRQIFGWPDMLSGHLLTC